MNNVELWGETIRLSLAGLWERFINFLPAVVGAIVVFVIGWMISVVIGKVARKILKSIGVDKVSTKVGLDSRINNIGIDLSVSEFFGELVKWFLILVFLMSATSILGLEQITDFLNQVIMYIPNVIVAVIILSAVLLLGNFVYGIVKGSTKAAGVVSATMLAAISKWAIILFGIFAALIQLGVAVSLVSTIFIGIIAMLALAGGLAFGLGGKEEAQLILKKIREEIVEK